MVAQCGGEVDRPGADEHADDQVAQAGHDLRAGPGAQLGGVLGKGHVADVVQAVLDLPVPADEVGEPGRAGLVIGQAGDRVDDHAPPPPGAKVADAAGDLDELGSVREPEPADGDGFEGAQLDAAVRLIAGVRSRMGTLCQARAAQRSSRVGWLALTVNR